MGPADEDLTERGHHDDGSDPFVAVRRWLALGSSVVVRGDHGSGRSRLLRRLLADASRRGTPALLLRAGGESPGAALRGHRSAGQASPLTWLVEELQGRRPVLLVDDLDLLDTTSAEVVLEALRTTSAALVATTTTDLTRDARPAVAAIAAQTAPTEVRIAPLSFRAVAGLLTQVLGGPPDVALVSAVTARSGGNPAVARALAEAARYAHAVRLVDGRWVTSGSLADVPVDAVAHVLLPRLPAEQVRALEVLAWAGPVTPGVAEALVPPDVLTPLGELGRLRRAGADDTLAVAPPALAAALRARLAPARRRALTARLEQVVGPRAAPFDAVGPGAAELVVEPPDTEYWWWTGDLTSLLLERSSAQEAVLRTAWLAAPSVAHAAAYLDVLLRRHAAAQVGAVLEGTERSGQDTLDDLVDLVLAEAWWASWQGEDEAALQRRADRWQVVPDPLRVLHDARRRARRALDEPDPAPPVPDAPGEGSHLQRWAAVCSASELLDAGRPDLAGAVALAALDRPEADRPAGRPLAEVEHHLAGLDDESLMLAGRVPEAARQARARLERAVEDLDVVGVRVHACSLAQALALTGDLDASWHVISTSLRVGPGGPLDNAFYRRTLTIGAVLLARRGVVEVARVLVDELDRTPPGYRTSLRGLAPLAGAALVSVTDPQRAGDLLWEAGGRYARDGAALPALVCLLMHPGVYDADRLAVVRRAAADCRAPLLDPYLRLHEALAAGDQDGVVAALPGVRLDVAGLVRTAVSRLDAEHTADPLVARLRRTKDDEPRQEPLSVREREVAAMAAYGLTNRQIADRLELSVRTVENHVSSALHKLGAGQRTELVQWFAAPRSTRNPGPDRL